MMIRKQTVQLVLGIVFVGILAVTSVLLFTNQVLPRTFAQEREEEKAVWCFDVVIDANGSRHTFGHPPSTMPQSSVAQSVGGTATERHCFDSWAGAAAYITDGKVLLADNATEEDYVRETDRLFRIIVTPVPATPVTVN